MGRTKRKKSPPSASKAFKAPAFGTKLPEDLLTKLCSALVSSDVSGKDIKAETGLQLHQIQKIVATGRAQTPHMIADIESAMDKLGVTLPTLVASAAEPEAKPNGFA